MAPTALPSAQSDVCQKCGQPLGGLAPAGICSRCLLQTGLDPTECATLLHQNGAPLTSPEGLTVRQFGDYELLEELARGGMGIVYKARQISLDRLVAVKMLLFGQYSSEEFVHRFRIEASAAASLRHPNIVAIHEVGVQQGQHYFVMELVDGPDLARRVRDKPLAPGQAARYVKSIAEAIHFAHERRILHRDLKPSNVLIDSNDQPRITDFGLAKRLSEDSDLTVTGQVLGSPNFMPPEQASAQRGQIGPASDVYSMGAVLYHALTGRSPFIGETLADTLQQVLHKEPLSPRLLAPSTPPDLETICLKCLEKEPDKRYHTAQELADELGRFLRDEPIRARPTTRLERGWRWCRRNPLLSGSLGLVALLLLLLGIGGPLAALTIRRSQKVTEANLYVANIYRANEALAAQNVPSAREFLDAINASAAQRKWRRWEWRFLTEQARSDERCILGQHDSWPAALAASPREDLLATICEDGVVSLWNTAQTNRVARWSAHANVLTARPDWGHHWVVFTPDGSRLFTAGEDGAVRCWDSRTNKLLYSVEHLAEAVNVLAISHDGTKLAGQGWGKCTYLWHVAQDRLELIEEFRTDSVVPNGVAFSPDDKILLVCWADKPVIRFELSGTSPTSERPIAGSTGPFAFSADGKWLVTAGPGRHIVQRWTWPTLEPLPERRVKGGVVNSFDISPDSHLLAAGLMGGQLNVWSLAQREPQEARVLCGHEDSLIGVAFAKFGTGVTLASVSGDKTVRLWDPGKDRTEPLVIPFGAPVLALAISPTGQHFAAAVRNRIVEGQKKPGANFTLQLRDFKTRFEVASIPFGSGGGLGPGLRFSPDGRELGVTDYERLGFYAVPTLQSTAQAGAHGLVYASDRRSVFYVAQNGTTITKRAGPDEPETVFARERHGIQQLALSPDGQVLASGDVSGEIRLWNARDGQELGVLKGHTMRVVSVTFTPDGQTLVSASWDGRLGIWDVPHRRKLALLRGHNNEFNSAAISPDGGTIASGGADNMVRLWSIAQRQEIAVLRGHTGSVNDVAFSADGEWLASASDDGTVRFWHAPPLQPLLQLEKFSQTIAIK